MPSITHAQLTALHGRTAHKVYRICLFYIRQPQDAEELCQEVFVKAFFKLSQFREEASIDTWLYRVAINTCLDHLRKQKRRARLHHLWSAISGSKANIEPTDNLTPSHILEQYEAQETLFVALDMLPQNQRKVFVLSKIDGLSLDEIVVITQLTKGAVESLQHRAKANLKREILKMIGDPSQVLPNYNV